MSQRIDELIAGLQELRELLKKRRKRDKVVALLTDQFLAWRGLSAEVSGSMAEFSEGAAKPTREDEESERPVLAVQHETPLTSLLASEGGPEDEVTDEVWTLVTTLREADDVEEAAALLQEKMTAAIRHARLLTVRAMIRHIWQGCLSPWEMMKHALAITRAYARPQLRGISQTELSLLLNETRQATSARERRLHDELLERWGVRGYKPDGGLKSESARASYRKAQMGNDSRRKGQRRLRRSQILSGGRQAAAEANNTNEPHSMP